MKVRPLQPGMLHWIGMISYPMAADDVIIPEGRPVVFDRPSIGEDVIAAVGCLYNSDGLLTNLKQTCNLRVVFH
jgi:hypothetical protein